MLTFPFGSDIKFTLIPKVNDEPIPQSEMVDLTVKIRNTNQAVNFTPLWRWNDVGVEIEIQREQIKDAYVYTVVLDWRRPDSSFSDGYQDRMNYCTLIEFSKACNIVSEDTAIIEASPEYKGDSAYQIAVNNGFTGTEEEWLESLKGEKGDPFIYDDFTPEQIEELQKPATDAAALIPSLMQNYTLNGGSSKNTKDLEDEIVQLAGDIVRINPNIIPSFARNLYTEKTRTTDSGLISDNTALSSGYVYIKEGDIVNCINGNSNQCSFYNSDKSERVVRTYPATAPAGYPYLVIMYGYNNNGGYEDAIAQIIPSESIRKFGYDTVNFISQELTNNPQLVESADSAYRRSLKYPQIVQGNLFNKDSAIQGKIYNPPITGNPVGMSDNENYVSQKIVVVGLTSITLTRVRVVVFSDSNDRGIRISGDGTISDSIPHTFNVPAGATYINVSIQLTNQNTALIVEGENLPEYSGYTWDLVYNGKSFIDLVLGFLSDDFTVNEYYGFELGSISGAGVLVNSNNRVRGRVKLEDDVLYNFSVEGNANKLAAFRENENGILTSIGVVVETITGSSEYRYLWVVASKADQSNFLNSEIENYKIKISRTISKEEYVEYIRLKINDLEKKNNNELIFQDTSLIQNNRVLKSELDSIKSNISGLYNIKREGESDIQTINLPNSNGGKFILNLHRRENSGFNTANDAYLPNAQRDFSDVRISSNNNQTLGYKEIYNGNIDVISDSRVIDGSLIYVDTYGVMYGRKVGIPGVVKSEDGITTTVLNVFSDLSAPVVMHITKDNTMLVGAGSIIYRSVYPYVSKEIVLNVKELTGYDTTMLSHSIVQHPDGELFYGTYQNQWDSRIYKSTDDGVTWEESIRVQDIYQHVHNMSIDIFQNPVAIYAGFDGGGGIYRTIDKGATWTDLRSLNPDMPQSSDYGVIYSEPGFRLIGGETSIVEGHSIIKTTDDLTYKVVLSDGKGVYFVKKLGNKLFAGELSSTQHLGTAIIMSDDNGETWKTVYATGYQVDTGASDGFRYLSKPTNDEIIVGCQSLSGTKKSLRIFEGGDNYFSSIIVDVPEGVTSINIESGYLIGKKELIYNDSKINDPLFYAPLNENSEVISYYIKGDKRLVKKGFNYKKQGKKLAIIYPPIINPFDEYSAILQPGDFLAKENLDLSQSNFRISFWLNDWGMPSTLNLLIKDGVSIRIQNGFQLQINNVGVTNVSLKRLDDFMKIDYNFQPDGRVQLFVNGVHRGTSTGIYLSQLSALTGNIEILSIPPFATISNDTGFSIQHFEISSGNITEEESRYNYFNGLFDNM